MNFNDEATFTAYRIGLGHDLQALRHYLRHRQWAYAGRKVRRMTVRARNCSWWGLWQSEYPTTCRFARRGLTARAAERRMRRDATIRDLTGAPSLWQTWRTAQAEGFTRAETRTALRARADAMLEAAE